MSSALVRCRWCGDDPLYVRYHDEEWGVPSHDDTHLFEMLVLEGAQAGLSWLTVLKKRAGYREAFAGFDAARVARFTPARIDKLMTNPAIVRNRAKINAAVGNARAVLGIREEFGSLDRFLWQFAGNAQQVNGVPDYRSAPARTDASDAMSRALIGRGMKFVGSTICYAFMQATGMVDDHEDACFRKAGRKKGEK